MDICGGPKKGCRCPPVLASTGPVTLQRAEWGKTSGREVPPIYRQVARHSRVRDDQAA